MSGVRCPACGAGVPGAQAGCQPLWDELATRAYGNLRYASVRDVAFDTYCMQHVVKYCGSAKSYAAHLCRLCCGLEFGDDRAVYAAIQCWLNGPRTLEKPKALPFLGRLTIADAQAADNPGEQIALVRCGAESVWDAYAPQQEIARAWLDSARAFV